MTRSHCPGFWFWFFTCLVISHFQNAFDPPNLFIALCLQINPFRHSGPSHLMQNLPLDSPKLTTPWVTQTFRRIILASWFLEYLTHQATPMADSNHGHPTSSGILVCRKSLPMAHLSHSFALQLPLTPAALLVHPSSFHLSLLLRVLFTPILTQLISETLPLLKLK